jgi:hypothetical protein
MEPNSKENQNANADSATHENFLIDLCIHKESRTAEMGATDARHSSKEDASDKNGHNQRELSDNEKAPVSLISRGFFRPSTAALHVLILTELSIRNVVHVRGNRSE